MLFWYCLYNESPLVIQTVSEKHPSTFASVLPQGSVLGPTLFLLFINDIDEIFCGTGVRMKLFADDVKLYCSFDKFSYDLQIVCDKLTEWANKRDEKDRVDSFSLALTRMLSNLLILTTSSQHIERCIIVRQLSVRHWTTFICLLTMVNEQY